MKSSRVWGFAVVLLLSTIGVRADERWTRLSMSGNSIKQWHFVGGEWKQDAEGIITSPGTLEEHHLAFHRETAYANLEADSSSAAIRAMVAWDLQDAGTRTIVTGIGLYNLTSASSP